MKFIEKNSFIVYILIFLIIFQLFLLLFSTISGIHKYFFMNELNLLERYGEDSWVVITGASSNHFDVLIGFLDNYIRMAEHTNIPLFVYDLGLSNVQATHLEQNYAQVVIRKFEYEKYLQRQSLHFLS